MYKARWNWDHPHACGDKAYTVGILLIPTGSSPRVWGQVYYHQINVYLRRIIPTRVGTSCLYNTFFIWSKDHPHACGDKHELCALRADMDGSSPRVWGQEYRRGVKVTDKRIIPTRVGTRPLLRRSAQQARDHPHACGDKSSVHVSIIRSKGSSPRVWGQVDA